MTNLQILPHMSIGTQYFRTICIVIQLTYDLFIKHNFSQRIVNLLKLYCTISTPSVITKIRKKTIFLSYQKKGKVTKISQIYFQLLNNCVMCIYLWRQICSPLNMVHPIYFSQFPELLHQKQTLPTRIESTIWTTFIFYKNNGSSN